MSNVSPPVAGQWQVWKKEIKRSEAAIQVVVNVSIGTVQTRSYFFTLKCPRGSQDSDGLEDFQSIELSPFLIVGLEDRKGRLHLQEILHFFLNHADISSHVIHRETDLGGLFLLHEDLVGHIVDDVFAEHWSRKMLSRKRKFVWFATLVDNAYGICILCTENSWFPTQHEIITLGSKWNCDTTAEEDKGEHVAILDCIVIII